MGIGIWHLRFEIWDLRFEIWNLGLVMSRRKGRTRKKALGRGISEAKKFISKRPKANS